MKETLMERMQESINEMRQEFEEEGEDGEMETRIHFMKIMLDKMKNDLK